jgi:hypothetical protein
MLFSHFLCVAQRIHLRASKGIASAGSAQQGMQNEKIVSD